MFFFCCWRSLTYRHISTDSHISYNNSMTDQKIKKLIFDETNPNTIDKFLRQNPNVDLRLYKLQNNSNILHHLSYFGRCSIIEYFLDHTYNLLRKIKLNANQMQRNPKQQLLDWINSRNQDGFTPLLYASFNGHVEVIELLVSRGANFTIKNYLGLGPLHVAAQNNKVSTLIYFQGKLDFNEKDNNGITPLHWASCNGSQQAVAYLLTVEDINTQLLDAENQTPLLLATEYGNTKIVRRLLMKGAHKNVRNNNNKTPLQIAQQSNFENIAKMLDQSKSCCNCIKFYYNVKVKYQPTTRSIKMPIVYILSTILALTIMNSMMEFTMLYNIIQAVIFGLMLILYLSLLKSPRNITKTSLPYYNTDKMCFQCCRKKPKRGYHCDICGVCIEQYDHHCTWINNCVGKHNIIRFVLFIVLLVLGLFIIGSCAILGILQLTLPDKIHQNILKWRLNPKNNNQKIILLILLSINTLISLFIIPIFLLLVVQLKNLLNNTTTYERARGQNKKMSLSNCIKMCYHTNIRQSLQSQSSSVDDQLLSH